MIAQLEGLMKKHGIFSLTNNSKRERRCKKSWDTMSLSV